MVKDQDSKISDLSMALREVTDRIGNIRKAHELVESMKNEPKRNPEKNKDKEQER